MVREFKWPPNVIGGLFIDDEDYRGIMFWYNDLAEVIEEVDQQVEEAKK